MTRLAGTEAAENLDNHAEALVLLTYQTHRYQADEKSLPLLLSRN